MDLDIATADLEAFSAVPIKAIDFNASNLAVFQVSEDTEATSLSDPVYEQFLADVWVGIVLTLMVLSCVCLMCSCLIYHKFQEWKHRVGDIQNSATLEAGAHEVDLPSYTIASGLPTYEEALEQLKKVKECQHSNKVNLASKTFITGPVSAVRTLENVNMSSRDLDSTLSVFNLPAIYNRDGESGFSKPS